MEKSVLLGKELEDEFCEIARSLGGDVESRNAGDDFLSTSPAARHGAAPSWSMAPKIIDKQTLAILKDAAETMASIMDAATRYYLKQPNFRKWFNFKPEHEALTCQRGQTTCLLPLARVDIFLNEETGKYWLCEVNTDGSAGFTANDCVTHAIEDSMTFWEFWKKHPTTHGWYLRDGMIDSILSLFEEWRKRVGYSPAGDPLTLALVDYRESIEWGEAGDFITTLRQRGIDSRFSDIRTLHFEKIDGTERLCDEVGPLDFVWKRAVTGEIFDKPTAGADAMAEAIKNNTAFVFGGFNTWPATNKRLFALLQQPEAANYLTDEQLAFVAAHVPETHLLMPGVNLNAFAANQSEWIAKPSDRYNASGVVAGADVTAESWQATLARLAKERGVVQKYAPQYATPAILGHGFSSDQPLEFPDYNNMLGLFVVNGKFTGVFSRCGQSRVIGEFQGRLEQGCLLVDE